MDPREKDLRSRLGDMFDKAYNHIDEGNDRHDLILTVLESLTLSDESTDEFIKEVKAYV